MNYKEQRDIIDAAMQGFIIVGRKRGSEEDWVYYDPRYRDKRIAYINGEVLFNFQDYEYKVLDKLKHGK